jgi:type IV secretory pathway TrbF-like protein
MSSGGVNVSASSSRIGVARNAPATTLIPLACTLLIAWMTLPCLVLSGSNHDSVPYVIVGRTTELYTNLALAKDAPHVEVVTRRRAATAATPFWRAILAWALHLSLGSSHTPSTRTLVVGFFSMLSSLTLACKLCFLRAVVKWISSYLWGAKVMPCRSAQAWHFSCTLLSRVQFCSVEAL